jgi:hypothetical protein
MSADKICYPTSHIPFYIVGIVFVTLIFFMTFFQSNEQKYYQYFHSTNNKYEPMPQIVQNIRRDDGIVVGNHNSAHGSAIHAVPFVG